jgi:hypothetical protein
MAVSRLLPSGGANDFNVALTGEFTSVDFDKEYSPGAYTMSSSLNDSSYDIYAYAIDGSLAGYTKTPSLTVTKGFIKMVIIGGTNNDLLSFSYKKTYTSVNDSDEVTAGPVAASLTPSNVPNIDDSFTLTGRNFASNVEVYFSSGTYTSALAKSIVRSSATSLIVTRPDNLPVSSAPYTITVVNPGVTNPTGTNSHILSNSISAGTNPAWTTSATLTPYTVGFAYNVTLVATDTEGSDIDYSIVSGTLPGGISLNAETGALTGTPTTAVSEGTTTVVTVRATDAGGNYLDRAFTFTENNAPTWTTASGALPSYATSTAYSNQLVASGGTVASTLTYTVASGSLPSGFSLSTSGLISGTTTTTTTSSFTVRVTDTAAAYTDRAFTLKPGFGATGGDIVGTYGGYKYHKFNTSGTFSVVSAYGTVEVIAVGGGGCGNSGSSSGPGGGAGALYYNTAFTMPSGATNYTITIGAGGPSLGVAGPLPDNTSAGPTYRGGTTTAFGISAIGGGAAGSTSTQVDQGAFGNLGSSHPGDGGSGAGTYNGTAITFNGLNYGRTAVAGVANFYGNNSGTGHSSGGAGGGGAGAVGANSLAASVGGDGGAGMGFNWTGTTEYLAAGGGGGSGLTTGGGSGNGGGAGGSSIGGVGGGGTNNGTNAVANTGSGGGGSGSGIPGSGSAGTVWIRYAF